MAREALHDRMPAKLRVEETRARDGKLRSIRVRTPERSLSSFSGPGKLAQRHPKCKRPSKLRADRVMGHERVTQLSRAAWNALCVGLFCVL